MKNLKKRIAGFLMIMMGFTLGLLPGSINFYVEAEEAHVYNAAGDSKDIVVNPFAGEQGKFEDGELMHYLDQYAYNGKDLGAVYTKTGTAFKVWSPTASKVELLLYERGTGGDAVSVSEMIKNSANGIWSTQINKDLHGTFYNYRVTVDGNAEETVDIYAKAVGLDGNRGMIVDLSLTNPAGWESDTYVTQEHITDAIIWEVHVRDFSSHENSGISEENRGRYLAFTETGTTLNNAGKMSTGVDYLKELGVNYVHLLPVYDYDNKELSDTYNWGYDPKNYNVPEGQYSSDPTDPIARIHEFKQMVQSLHKAGIGVVMDVVYNHTGPTERSWLNLTVPKYYYRIDSSGNFLNGSACGNETASEHAMYRKYMIESVLYWAKEYHLDGFRFDLMGLHDTDTINAVRKALDEAGHEDIILYGEPWDAGTNGIDRNKGIYPANKSNVDKLSDGIAVFHDDIRDALKGSVFNLKECGFVQYTNRTANDCDAKLKRSMKGSIETWAKTPNDSIAYTSAHDNWTLWDKLAGSTNKTGYYNEFNGNLEAMNKMAAVGTFTSQGAAFFQAGEEFARTKLGDENSYKSSIMINQLDWSRVLTFRNLNNYYKGLIRLNKAYRPFRDPTGKSAQTMSFSNTTGTEGLVAYTIQNPNGGSGEWNIAAVIMNSTPYEQKVPLAVSSGEVPKKWIIVADKDRAGVISLGSLSGQTITIAPKSALVLIDKLSFESAGHKGYPDEKPVELDKMPEEKVYNIAGDDPLVFGTSWAPEFNEMTYEGDGNYSIIFKNIAAGTSLRFKIVEDGTILGWNSPKTFGVEGLDTDKDGNSVLQISKNSDLTIRYKRGEAEGRYVITPSIPERLVYNVAGDNIKVFGYAWAPEYNEMSYQEDGRYAITFRNIEAGTTLRFKIVENGTSMGWKLNNYSVEGLREDGDGNAVLEVLEASDLTIYYRPLAAKGNYMLTAIQ